MVKNFGSDAKRAVAHVVSDGEEDFIVFAVALNATLHSLEPLGLEKNYFIVREDGEKPAYRFTRIKGPQMLTRQAFTSIREELPYCAAEKGIYQDELSYDSGKGAANDCITLLSGSCSTLLVQVSPDEEGTGSICITVHHKGEQKDFVMDEVTVPQFKSMLYDMFVLVERLASHELLQYLQVHTGDCVGEY